MARAVLPMHSAVACLVVCIRLLNLRFPSAHMPANGHLVHRYPSLLGVHSGCPRTTDGRGGVFAARGLRRDGLACLWGSHRTNPSTSTRAVVLCLWWSPMRTADECVPCRRTFKVDSCSAAAASTAFYEHLWRRDSLISTPLQMR